MTRLVRVTLRLNMSDTDAETLRTDGYLWLAAPELELGWDLNDDLHWYRSLATGFEHLWYDHEVEDAPDGAEDAPDGAGEQADAKG